MSDEPKRCRNPQCTGKEQVKGNWCTAGACKKMRAQATKMKKEALLAGAAAAAGVAAPGGVAAHEGDNLTCYEVHSVHGVVECDFSSLGKEQQAAPAVTDKQVQYVVFGNFAASVDDYENEDGKDLLCLVKLSKLLAHCGDDDVAKIKEWENGRPASSKARRKRLREAAAAEE